jgi:protein-tyrosine kinase
MNRIHETLKKAEEQRASTRPAENAYPQDSGQVEVPHRDGLVCRSAEMVSRRRMDTVLTTSSYIRLDELRQRCAKPHWDLDPDTIVFCKKESFDPRTEQFRTLRSRLYRLREKQPIRTLLITSSVPGEGKTFVASNLAQAIVRQHERRALLIDADLRRSKVHLSMGAPSAPGLADYLGGEADEFSIMQTDSQGNLFLIPAGRPMSNPAELLTNGQLKNLLDRLAPVFDWVILDAPPTLPVSDASVLAGLSDGVIFVVRAASTPFDLVQTACQEFREKNLLGFVLNRAEEEATYGAYSYYAESGAEKK